LRRVRIGRVGRAQGTEGAFRVSEPTERLELLDAGRRVYLGDRPLVVEWRKGPSERPVIKLDSMADRASAESVAGVPITVPREEIGPLADGEYLLDDLVGCEVKAGRLAVGAVRDVLLLPSVEALVVDRPQGKELLVPLVADAVENIDVEDRRIEVRIDFLQGG
jgi:16S rRNA processing protein RimM